MKRGLAAAVLASVASIALVAGTRAAPVSSHLHVVGGGDGYRLAHEWRYDEAAIERPRFAPEDLPTIARELRLSGAQRAVVESLLVDHAAAVAALALELDPESATVPTFAATMRAGRLLLPSLLEEAGLDPDLLDDGRITVEMGTATFEDPGGPRAEVSVRLEPREGAELTEDDATRLGGVALVLGSRLQAIEQARAEAKAEAERAGVTPDDLLVRVRQAAAAQRAALEAYRLERRVLETRLASEILLLLSESQAERWPFVVQALRRARTLPWGTLHGEAIDLDALLAWLVDRGALEIPRDRESEVTAIVEAWRLTLDPALARRNEALRQLPGDVDRAAAQGDARRLLRAHARLATARRDVRDVTRRAVRQLAGLLADAPGGPTIEATWDAWAFPTLTEETGADARFARALERRDLPREVRESVATMDAERRRERSTADERLRERWQRDDPDIAASAGLPAAELLDPEVAARATPDLGELEALLAARRERDTEWIERLDSVLAGLGGAADPASRP